MTVRPMGRVDLGENLESCVTDGVRRLPMTRATVRFSVWTPILSPRLLGRRDPPRRAGINIACPRGFLALETRERGERRSLSPRQPCIEI